MNSSHQSLIDGNISEISEDRKPILSLLPSVSDSTAELNNVSEPIPNSNSPKATPDNKEWLLYRPRTRSAKKKLLFAEVIVISSDSEGSDVECTRNPYVMEIVPKTEIVSDDSVLNDALLPRVILTDCAGLIKQEPIKTEDCGAVHQPPVLPEKILSAPNTSPMADVLKDVHSPNCSNDNDSTDAITENIISPTDLSNNDDYIQSAKDSTDVGSTDSIVDDDVKQNVTGTEQTVEIISNVSLLEDVAESHIITHDNSELLDAHEPFPVNELSADTSSIPDTQQEPHSSYFNDNDSSEPATGAINQNIIPRSDSSNNDDYSQTVEDNPIDINSTTATVDDDAEQNIVTDTATKKELILDVPSLEEIAVSHVTDNKESLQQQKIVTESCVETDELPISPVEVPSLVSTSLLVIEMEENLYPSCSNGNGLNEPVTDNNSQAEQIILSDDLVNGNNENKTLVEDSTRYIGSIEADVDRDQNIEHTATEEESPELLVYGIGQRKRKYIFCECSSCKKGEYTRTVSIDKTELVTGRVNQLKRKCLQFDLECESDLNDGSMVNGNGSSEPCQLPADNSPNSVGDAYGLEHSSPERLEWSSDQDDVIAEELILDDGESNPDNFFNIYKIGHADDSAHIRNWNVNLNRTKISKAYNADDELSEELSQKPHEERHSNGQSLSDGELIISGRYGQRVTNEGNNLRIVFANSAVGGMKPIDMAKRMWRANDDPAPTVENDDSLPAEGHTPTLSVSSKSQDDDASMVEPNAGNSEYEREYGQRPLEKDDKLLKRRFKRRWSMNSINLTEISEKRRHMEASTDSDSDDSRIRKKTQTHRKPKKSSLKKRMGGFFRNISENLREKRKKMTAKLSRRRKVLRNRRASTTDNFVVTPYREDTVVESMKGFIIIPDRQDIESEEDT